MPLVTNDKQKKDRNEYMHLALTIFAESTGWIAFPVVGALYLGRWLDERQGTEPLYFFSLTALAFIVSTIGIGITGVKYMKLIEKKEAILKTLSETPSVIEGSVVEGKKKETLKKSEEDLKKKEDNESRHKS